MLKPNRAGQAWWIWAPLGGLTVARALLPATPVFALSKMIEPFLEALGATGFGLAVAWLVSAYLVRRGRFTTFLGRLRFWSDSAQASSSSSARGSRMWTPGRV